MPRGKFVNHKGRSRHFTSPEKLQQESEEESDQSGSGSDSDAKDGKTDKVSGSAAKPKQSDDRNSGSDSRQVARRQKQRASGGAGGSSESESEEDFEAEARDAKKGVTSLIEIDNPNRVSKKGAQKLSAIKLNDGPNGGARKPELSRREREHIEKQKARQRYEKLHAAGNTSEAKADLARLALIRQQREEAAAKREAEKKGADAGGKKPGTK